MRNTVIIKRCNNVITRAANNISTAAPHNGSVIRVQLLKRKNKAHSTTSYIMLARHHLTYYNTHREQSGSFYTYRPYYLPYE